jgi:3-phenylpropionate/trans-cinnamate dioxygenase ferredoxin reductase subunit
LAGPGIAIVGGGDCGARAALELRAGGYGGSITVVTKEQHLPYEHPPLSKTFLSSEREPEPALIADPATYATLGIDVLLEHEATAIDRRSRRIEFADGTGLPYEKLLLATGSVARPLRGAGADPRIVTLRTLDDARRIRSAINPRTRVVCVGGGFIGLEVAASARRNQASVTVVEALPSLMNRVVPTEVATAVADLHRHEGVEILVSTPVKAIHVTPSELRLVLESDREITADLVVVGIGAIPATTLAEEAGLRIDNGVAVDSYLQTSDPTIFAAGDCCSYPDAWRDGRRTRLESWRNAINHSRLVAMNMLDDTDQVRDLPSFWSDQYDSTLEVVGHCDEPGSQQRWDGDDGAFIVFQLDSQGVLVGASGIGHGTSIARHFRVIERLIAARARPPARQLTAKKLDLKSLLRQSRGELD